VQIYNPNTGITAPRLGQKDGKFKARLSYVLSPYFKRKKKKKKEVQIFFTTC
jgi:hypothetical protein